MYYNYFNFNICCIRVKTIELWKLLDIVGYIYIYIDEWCCIGPKRLFVLMILMFGTGYIQVLYLGRSPHTKETLPDFHENVRLPDIHEYSAG